MGHVAIHRNECYFTKYSLENFLFIFKLDCGDFEGKF